MNLLCSFISPSSPPPYPRGRIKVGDVCIERHSIIAFSPPSLLASPLSKGEEIGLCLINLLQTDQFTHGFQGITF